MPWIPAGRVAESEGGGSCTHLRRSGDPTVAARERADTDLPTAILLDPCSGQVRGILRDRPQADAAAARSPRRPSLDVLVSRGIPDAAAWSR